MEPGELRHRLAALAGEDRYLQFLRALNRGRRWRRRFLHWQESLLAEAGVVVSSPGELFDRVEPLLRLCELHDVELCPDPTGIAMRCRGALPNDDGAHRSFPNTDCGPIHADGRPLHGGESTENLLSPGLWYCPVCREAEADRPASSSRGEKHLIRRATMKELAEAWGVVSYTGWRAEKWDAFRTEVESCLSEGGELWEWETDGFRSFAGSCGVAVVRDGRWVKEWQLGRS